MSAAPTRYSAFLSYKHGAHDRLATLLQTGIQRIGVPWYRRSSTKVFLDRGDLSAQPSLWTTLKAAVHASDYFVLLASPGAAASPWVAREVREWRECGAPERTLLVLLDGELRWDPVQNGFDAATTVIPPDLGGFFAEEPLWVDARWANTLVSANDARLQDATASIAAAIRRIPKRELIGEELRLRRWTNRIAAAVTASLTALTIAVAVVAFLFFQQKNEALRQKSIADTQRRDAVAAALAARAGFEQALPDTDLLPRTILLGVESYRLRPSLAADQVLRRALNLVPVIVRRTPMSGVRATSFSGDGRFMVGEDVASRRLGVWRTDTGTRVTSLPESAVSAALSHDGRWLVYGTSQIVDLRVRHKAFLASGPGYETTRDLGISDVLDTVEFSRDDRHFYAITEEFDGPHGSIEVFDIDSERSVRLGSLEPELLPPYGAAFHPDGEHIAVGFLARSDEHTSVFTLDGKEQWRIPKSGSPSFSSNGRELWVGGNAFSWASHASIRGVTPPFSRQLDPTRVLTATGGVVKVLDARDKHELKRINSDRAPNDEPGPFAILPDGKVMTMTGGDILVWDVTADELKTTDPTGPKMSPVPKDLAGSWVTDVSRDGKLWAARLDDRETIAVAPLQGVATGIARRHLGDADLLRFSPDASLLLVAHGSMVEVWNAPLTRQIAAVRLPQRVPANAACRFEGGAVDSDRFSVADSCNLDGKFWSRLFLWDHAGHQIQVIDSDGEVEALAFAPNGGYIGATFSYAGATFSEYAARIWRIGDGARLIDERQPKDAAVMAFSNDSRHAVISGERETLRVWEIESKTEVARLDCCGPRSLVEFDRDGPDLILGRPAAVRLVWDTTRLIERACAHVPANLSPAEFAALMLGEEHHLTCPTLGNGK